MLTKIVLLFLAGMALLGMFGKLRMPRLPRIGSGRARCDACGRPKIGKGPCPCGRG